MMLCLSTLDLDFTDKEKLRRIRHKITKCPEFKRLEIEESAGGNGYHFIIWCFIKCCKCRLCFDDELRAYLDYTTRGEMERDVLFDKKIIYRNGEQVLELNSRRIKIKMRENTLHYTI